MMMTMMMTTTINSLRTATGRKAGYHGGQGTLEDVGLGKSREMIED